jgi:hypothetical protein
MSVEHTIYGLIAVSGVLGLVLLWVGVTGPSE